MPSDSPCFIVYDIDDWRIDYEDIKQALYGDTVTDHTLYTLELQKALCNLRKTTLKVYDEKIKEAISKGFYNVLIESLLLPQFSYNLQNGIFFLKESEEINGVITFRGEVCKIFPNPFVKNDRLIDYSKLVNMLP